MSNIPNIKEPTVDERSHRELVKKSRRWVVKIGSALLTADGKGLDLTSMADWVAQIGALVKADFEVVLVSSGAVAAGMARLGWVQRPTSVHQLQAAAAVGQSSLIQAYEQAFQKFGIQTAQILLDHDDFSQRERYLNARSTVRSLLSLGVIPIINENDTVVTDEIRFGDNDSLGALVANLIEADTLCLLTDQKAMFNSDPRHNPAAEILWERSAFDGDLDGMATSGGALGRGGMSSKVKAARLAARSGANTIIVGGRIEGVLGRVANGERVGTLLYSGLQPLAARKMWMAGNMQPKGVLILDDGAKNVLVNKGKSLLPVGVRSVEGTFQRGDLVLCLDQSRNEIARGLINYSSDEAVRIAGAASSEIPALIGYESGDELVHRDDLVLT